MLGALGVVFLISLLKFTISFQKYGLTSIAKVRVIKKLTITSKVMIKPEAKEIVASESYPKGILIPDYINQFYTTALIQSEAILVILAGSLCAIFKIPVFDVSNFILNQADITLVLWLGSLLSIIGILFDKIPLKQVQKIEFESKAFVLQILGRGFSPIWQIVGVASLLSLAAGVGEEFLFRGFLYQACVPWIGATPALLLTATAFGLAHFPVFGADWLVEALLGGAFGVAYEMSGHKLAVPILVHAVYDLVTILSTWASAREDIRKLSPLASRAVPLRDFTRSQAASLARTLELAAKEAFQLMDMNEDGLVDKEELALCMYNFRYGSKSDVKRTVDEIFATTDSDGDGLIDFSEFLAVLREQRRRLAAAAEKGVDDEGGRPFGWPVFDLDTHFF